MTGEHLQALIDCLARVEMKLNALAGPWPEWFDLETLSQYSAIPVETLWRFIKRKRNPLPCSQPGGTKGLVRVHRATFDRWMADQPRNGLLPPDAVGAMVEAAMTSIQEKDRGPH